MGHNTTGITSRQACRGLLAVLRLPVVQAAQAPQVEPGDLPVIQAPMDFLGLNHCTRSVVSASGRWDVKTSGRRLTEMGWEVLVDNLEWASGYEKRFGKVDLAEHLGDRAIVHLRVAGVTDLLDAKVGTGHARLEAGQALGLAADAAWALAFDTHHQLAA